MRPHSRGGDGIFDERAAGMAGVRRDVLNEDAALNLFGMTGGATSNEQLEEAVASMSGLEIDKIKEIKDSLLEQFLVKLKDQRAFYLKLAKCKKRDADHCYSHRKN